MPLLLSTLSRVRPEQLIRYLDRSDNWSHSFSTELSDIWRYAKSRAGIPVVGVPLRHEDATFYYYMRKAFMNIASGEQREEYEIFLDVLYGDDGDPYAGLDGWIW